jgi:hypothetical protein
LTQSAGRNILKTRVFKKKVNSLIEQRYKSKKYDKDSIEKEYRNRETESGKDKYEYLLDDTELIQWKKLKRK